MHPLAVFEHAVASYGRTQVGPVDLTVTQGQIVGLIGHNGSGKTTVMRMATGLVPLDSGAVHISGESVQVGRMPSACTALIEVPAFLQGLSAYENLLLSSGGDKKRRDRIPSALEAVGLDIHDRRAVRKYSQGNKQRLGIARVLLADAPLVFLDEPANGLDPSGLEWLSDFLKHEARNGRAFVVSSHSLNELDRLASHVMVLESGRVIHQGSLRELSTRYENLEALYRDGRPPGDDRTPTRPSVGQ